MKVRQYINYNFNRFFLIFCLIILTAFYLFSCAPEPPKEINEDFMEGYIERAEAKFKEEAKQDSIKEANLAKSNHIIN